MINATKNINEPIFIVGVPRSGTTLLAAMIGAHSRISCGTETDYFHFLAQADANEICNQAKWPEGAVNFLCAMTQAKDKSPVPMNYGLTRDILWNRLNNAPRNPASILRAITEFPMEQQGKYRWAEKTPRHIFHLKKIRELFPNARIIRIIRDPRDTALSIIKAPWQWAPRNYAAALYMWKFCDDAGRAFFESDSLSLSIRYEELICQPTASLMRICDFIGENYEPSMLETHESYKQINSIAEPWKVKVGQALDQTRVSVWQRELSHEDKMLSLAIVGDRLLDYGYEKQIAELRYIRPYPKDGPLYYDGWQEIILENKGKFWRSTRQDAIYATFLFGFPETDFWLGNAFISRITSLLRIMMTIISRHCSGKPNYWLRPKLNVEEGKLSRLLTIILPKMTNVRSTGRRNIHAVQWRINLIQNPRLGQFTSQKERVHGEN